MHKYLSLILAALTVLSIAHQATASSIGITSVADLGTTATIDWSQLGPAFTSLSGPQTVTTSNGLSATVTSAGGVFERRDEGNGWSGSFAPGTALLWDQTVGPDITFSFSAPVSGFGAQIEADSYGPFTAMVEVLGANGSVLGTFSENGNTTSNNDGSAIFIGLKDSTADITGFEFLLPSSSGASGDFAIGPVAVSAVPVPGALTLFGSALFGFGAFARQRAKKTA